MPKGLNHFSYCNMRCYTSASWIEDPFELRNARAGADPKQVARPRGSSSERRAARMMSPKSSQVVRFSSTVAMSVVMAQTSRHVTSARRR